MRPSGVKVNPTGFETVATGTEPGPPHPRGDIAPDVLRRAVRGCGGERLPRIELRSETPRGAYLSLQGGYSGERLQISSSSSASVF